MTVQVRVNLVYMALSLVLAGGIIDSWQEWVEIIVNFLAHLCINDGNIDA